MQPPVNEVHFGITFCNDLIGHLKHRMPLELISLSFQVNDSFGSKGDRIEWDRSGEWMGKEKKRIRSVCHIDRRVRYGSWTFSTCTVISLRVHNYLQGAPKSKIPFHVRVKFRLSISTFKPWIYWKTLCMGRNQWWYALYRFGTRAEPAMLEKSIFTLALTLSCGINGQIPNRSMMCKAKSIQNTLVHFTG